jgi:D-amino peptidase
MMRNLLLCTALAALGAVPAAAQPQPLKIYISVDMEGAAGVVSADQLSPAGFEYQRAREWLTRETLAAVEAARAMGAAELVVADSHGNAENLLIDQLPGYVRVVRGFPRRLEMMAGIDASFSAAFLIGYHASTNNLRGTRAHTFSSAHLTRVLLNGTAITEGANNAAIAGHFGVPVVMISGDDAAVAEIQALIGNVEAAVTKKSLGYHSAETMTPAASCELIGQKVKAALGRVKDFKPYVLKGPITVEVGFKNYRPVEMLALLRGVERIDSHAIRYQAKDVLDASDFLQFVTGYSISLEP